MITITIDSDDEEEKDCIELFGLPYHYRFHWLWTSDLIKSVVSSLQVNNQLVFYDPCTGVFCLTLNDKHGYLVLDCTHFACPKTESYDLFYAHNEKIRLSKIVCERNEFVARLEKIYGFSICCVYDCTMKEYMPCRFENGEELFKQTYLEIKCSEILYEHTALEMEKW